MRGVRRGRLHRLAGVRAPGERTVLGGPCVGYGQAAKLSRCFSHRALASATSHMQSSMAKKRRRWGAVAQTATSEMAWSQCRSSWSRPRSKQACTNAEASGPRQKRHTPRRGGWQAHLLE